MSGSKWDTVKLPKELIEKAKKFLDSHKELGFVSVNEFVRDAVREKLQALESEILQRKTSSNSSSQEGGVRG